MTSAETLKKLVMAGVAAMAFVTVSLAAPAAAQGRPQPAVELAVGWIGFADDGVVGESLVDRGRSLRRSHDPNGEVG